MYKNNPFREYLSSQTPKLPKIIPLRNNFRAARRGIIPNLYIASHPPHGRSPCGQKLRFWLTRLTAPRRVRVNGEKRKDWIYEDGALGITVSQDDTSGKLSLTIE